MPSIFDFGKQRKFLRRLLVFRPQPTDDRFLDVFERFLFIATLRYAAGECGAFDDIPTIGLFHRHMEDHGAVIQRLCGWRYSAVGMIKGISRGDAEMRGGLRGLRVSA